MRGHRIPRAALGLSCAILITLASVRAAGQSDLGATDMGAAAEAFSRAHDAAVAGEWQKAAALYELAHATVPSPEALRSALRARRRAGDLAAAATWALELQRLYPTDRPSQELAQSSLEELRPKLAEVVLRCTPAPCAARIDGAALGTVARALHHVFVMPGRHEVVGFFGSRSAPPRQVVARAGSISVLQLAEPRLAPPVPPASAAPTNRVELRHHPGAGSASQSGQGLPWVVSVIAIAATGGLIGAAIWSGLDTLSARDVYEQAPTLQGYLHGEDLELRTNLLIVTSGVMGLATVGVAVFATDWRRKDRLADAANGPPLVGAAGALGMGWGARF